jgi:uncharacterized membrane protein
MKTRNIVTAIIALAGAAITIWQFGTSTFGILSGVNVAVIIAIGGLFVGRVLDKREDERQGFVVKDEMSVNLEAKAGRAAFQIGNYIWLALLWYEFLSNEWLPTPPLGSPSIVLIGLIGQLGVYFAARLYYGKNLR